MSTIWILVKWLRTIQAQKKKNFSPFFPSRFFYLFFFSFFFFWTFLFFCSLRLGFFFPRVTAANSNSPNCIYQSIIKKINGYNWMLDTVETHFAFCVTQKNRWRRDGGEGGGKRNNRIIFLSHLLSLKATLFQ